MCKKLEKREQKCQCRDRWANANPEPLRTRSLLVLNIFNAFLKFFAVIYTISFQPCYLRSEQDQLRL